MAETTQDLVAKARQETAWVDPEEARQRLAQGAVALDVRDDHEFDDGHVPGAVHITRGCLEFKIGDNPATKDPNAELLVYCKGGGRAALATQTLQRLGYTNAVCIEGGYDGWVAAGQPVENAGKNEEE